MNEKVRWEVLSEWAAWVVMDQTFQITPFIDKAQIIVTKPYLVVWYKFGRINPFSRAVEQIEFLGLFDWKVKINLTSPKVWTKENIIPLENYENLYDSRI